MPRTPDNVIEKAQELLNRGSLSQRKIAEKLKISRGTVGAIANKKLQPNGTISIGGLREQLVSHEKIPSTKCLGCDHNITVTPCVICRARRYKKEHKPTKDSEP